MDTPNIMDPLAHLHSNLTWASRAAIYEFLADPTEERWDNIHAIVVSVKPLRTVWQALRDVDPTFPAQSPARRGEGPGTVREPWPVVPRAFQLARALASVTE